MKKLVSTYGLLYEVHVDYIVLYVDQFPIVSEPKPLWIHAL